MRLPQGSALFWWSAGAALAVHAALLASAGPLLGGADLRPHLRLVQLMNEDPALRSVYAPFYHLLGAALAPLFGLAAYPRIFAFGAAAALIGGFRAFQRAAALPDAAAALFPWIPYLFALSWCSPKIEAAGYAVALAGLACLLRGRHVALALVLCAAFFVHTAAALFLGLCGGVLALANRDGRALLALGAGSAAASPLFALHLAAGCSLAESFLFSQGDYLRSGARPLDFALASQVALLSGPVALLALGGVRSLWHEHRNVSLLCLVIAMLYLNELWLAPFGARTTLDLVRGLTVLAFPVAICGGMAVRDRGGAAAVLVGVCALIAIAAAWLAIPDACFVRRHDLAEIGTTDVDRCTFRWWSGGSRQAP